MWDSIVASIQTNLTDDVIEEAVGRLPPEIFAINGPELIEALKVRRDNLRAPLEDFYEMLAKRVDLYATDVSELVVVDRTDPDFVTVSLADSESADSPYLQRRFNGSETDEVRIYTKMGDDQVSIRGDGGGDITIRVIGGSGDDAFEVNDSRDGVRLYDSQGDNTVSGTDAPGLDTKNFDEWVWSEEDRDQPRDWGGRTLPIFWTTYSTDLGIFLGAGFRLSPSVSSWISLALRAGGEKLWVSERAGAFTPVDFPWSDAAFLGGAETIRGWADQRFAGDAAVFGSGELRLRVFNPRVVVPVETGIFGFADAGRVYLDGDSPGGWHTSVGGGIWFKPVAQPYMLRAGAGVSDEGTKIHILLGLPY